MCRVPAPLIALFGREAAPSRPPLRLQRRFRIVRHRALRWFHQPIAIIERDRRERDLGPSLWPWPALLYAESRPTRRGGARVSSIRSIN